MPRSVSQARAIGSSSGTRATSSAMNSSRCNRDQGGGDKKQGLFPVVGTGQFSLWNGMRRAGSTPESRRKVFCLNQLGGGVGSGYYQTRAPSDGVKRPCKGSEDQNEAIPVAVPGGKVVKSFIAEIVSALMSGGSGQMRTLLQALRLQFTSRPLISGLNNQDGLNVAGGVEVASIGAVAVSPGSFVIPMIIGKDYTNTMISDSLGGLTDVVVARFSDNTNTVQIVSSSYAIDQDDYLLANVALEVDGNDMVDLLTGTGNLIDEVAGATAANTAVVLPTATSIQANAIGFDAYNKENKTDDIKLKYTNANTLAAGATDSPNAQSLMNTLKTRLDAIQLTNITTEPDFALLIGKKSSLDKYFKEQLWQQSADPATPNTLKSYSMETGQAGYLPPPGLILSNFEVSGSSYTPVANNAILGLLN